MIGLHSVRTHSLLVPRYERTVRSDSLDHFSEGIDFYLGEAGWGWDARHFERWSSRFDWMKSALDTGRILGTRGPNQGTQGASQHSPSGIDLVILLVTCFVRIDYKV
jgi:hypothetical protein